MGIGERDDLPGIAGICQDFLIAGHGGIENDFTHRQTVGTDRLALKHCAISKHKQSRSRGHRLAKQQEKLPESSDYKALSA